MSYKFVKYCRHCKKRFIIERSERKSEYCPECQKRLFEDDD